MEASFESFFSVGIAGRRDDLENRMYLRDTHANQSRVEQGFELFDARHVFVTGSVMQMGTPKVAQTRPFNLSANVNQFQDTNVSKYLFITCQRSLWK